MEAIIGSLNKIISDEVKLRIIHQGVGAITESDVTLSKATGAIILGFNVRSIQQPEPMQRKTRLILDIIQ